MRAMKLALRFAGVMGVAFLIGTPAAAQNTFSKIERGRYLVKAGDCAFCHNDKEGRPYAGGRAIATPFGLIYSMNITPDRETGIGTWSEQDFYNAMHHGIGNEGKHLYPACPYPWFTKLSRTDVDAIKAFLDILEPVKQENKPTELPWPLSWRGAMAVWNKVYFHEGEFKPDPQKSDQWNRGAYLVEGPGHCGACHTAKNPLGAVKNDKRMEGGAIGEYWYTPSLSSDLRDGVGGWSADEIVEYLKTGSNAKAAATGPMTDVVVNSTQYLSDADLGAIAIYLKDMPKKKDSDATSAELEAQALARGQALYADNCTGCHMPDGRGIARVFPSLKGNAALQAERPDTVIHVVLTGAKMAATPTKPTGLAMPAFDWKLDDQEITDVVNYIRHAWGNHAPLVSIGMVSEGRNEVVALPHK